MNISDEGTFPIPQEIAKAVWHWMVQIESHAIAVATIRPEGSPSDQVLYKLLDTIDCKISRMVAGRSFHKKCRQKRRVPFFGVIEGRALDHSLHAHLIFYGRSKISYLGLEKVFERVCENAPFIESYWIEEFGQQEKAGAMISYMLKGAKYIGVTLEGLRSLEISDRLFFSPALEPYTRALETPSLSCRRLDPD